MPTLFSLADASFMLAFPSAGPQLLERRVAAVATLDGAEVRDAGPRDAGLSLRLQTELDDAALCALQAGVAGGAPLGLSSGALVRAAFAERVEAAGLPGGHNAVTLHLTVAPL